MRHKIILYNPQAVFHTMPLALLAVGSVLDTEEYDVVIIDARLSNRAREELLGKCEGALCVGMSVLTGTPISDALDASRAIKDNFPGLPIIWGGWHPSLFAKETLREYSIDFTVQGQGELTFIELIEALVNNASVKEIKGISYRNNELDNSITQNPKRPMAEMNSFSQPDFELINVERYFELKGKRQLDYITSIGCHFRCAFCADPYVYNRQRKAIEPERLVTHLAQLWRKYRFNDVNFQDESFFTYSDYVATVAEGFIEQKLKFSWAATMRADQGKRMPDEIYQLCKDSGLRRLLIGVESGAPAIIKKIQKDTTLEQIVYSAEKCLQFDLEAIFSFIVGFPGETSDDVRKTLDFIKKLKSMNPKFSTPVFIFKPYPGSKIALDISDELPRTLEEWVQFDYVGCTADSSPWLPPQMKKYIENFKFYNSFAWDSSKTQCKPLYWLARARMARDCFRFPVERWLYNLTVRQEKLS